MSVASAWGEKGEKGRSLDDRSLRTTQISAIWRHFRKQRGGLVGLAVLALMIISVIVVPIISPLASTAVIIPKGPNQFVSPANPNPDMWFAPAATTDPATGLTYWLGSDKFGRDVLTRLFIGGRITLPAALIAAFFTVLLGTVIGLMAGFFGGWVDTLVMRVTDFMLAWPLIPAFVVFYRVILGVLPRLPSGSLDSVSNPLPLFAIIILTFLLFSWMGVARLVRISALSVRSSQFIEATRALGAGNARIMFKHLLPNVMTPVLVAGTIMVGDFILFEALLSFFGLGLTEPPGPSWGTLLAYGQSQIYAILQPNPFENIRFYLFLFPCMMILITVLSIHAIADALRKAMAIK
jgi:peptide/nickel transport system permease protein